MSEPPQEFDPALMYDTPSPQDGVQRLISLAVIFNYITGALHLLAALMEIGFAFFIPYILTHQPAGGPPPPPPVLMGVMYGVFSVVALAASIVSFIAANRLRKRQPGAFGWALASGIIGCVSLMWCSLGCVLPLASGIYTIVVMCQQGVRQELSGERTPQPRNG